MSKKAGKESALNVPANFGLSELDIFSRTRPDTPPYKGVDYTTIDVKDFVGKTPLERKLEMEDEEMEASGMLREVQLKQTRAWLRQVEEENEDKLRERLAEQRKVQQEHFRKLEIRGEYLPPNLAFANLPTGTSFKKVPVEQESETESEDSELRQRQSSKKWAENVHNQIAASPSLHSVHTASPGMSPRTTTKERQSSSCGSISLWILFFILHDLGLVLLSLWVFNRQDSKEIPWKWLSFLQDG